ncbi:MAG: AAA family ATPase [Chloroflexi bacterium]|nr:AAA family ATPase [Chloroflexota bacterium]
MIQPQVSPIAVPQSDGSARCLLHEITLRRLLSFGPQSAPLKLRGLNVFIGPNGSGKSNLLESVALLRAAPNRVSPNDMRTVIGRGGGVGEWVWKGDPKGISTLDAVVDNPHGQQPLRHVLAFRAEQQTFRLEDERIENERPYPGQPTPYFYYRYQQGQPVIALLDAERQLARESVEPDVSILAQRRDPDTYPVITELAAAYNRIRLYREWAFGRNTVFREPQKADLRTDRLEEDFSNLGLFLNRLRRQPKAKNALLAALRDLYEGLTDFDVSIEGGTVQVFFTEGEYTIPATRLSDGTLRYLCLLAVLCDPEPPPLIGIEEPELGLHPDILPKLADLMVEASQRTQLIITTHSDVLVDAFTERPEYVVVCEKHTGQTVMKRLEAKQLALWLEKYRLGELWTRGELGGTRW